MQPASVVSVVSPRKALRSGQQKVVEEAEAMKAGTLPIQLPTGYGKTLTAAAVFRALYIAGIVDHVLYLVPTVVQLSQFCENGKDDFRDAGLDGIVPIDVGQNSVRALGAMRSGKGVAFAATIQAVVAGATGIAIQEMLRTGCWLVVIDEYHHYGIDKTWGRAVRALPAVMTLAMSATPARRDQDSAFGEPLVRVSYKSAAEDKAAKQLILHAYEYRVDAVTVNGQTISFTTSDVAREVGSTDGNAIDKYVVDRKLRWSPKYISPLISIPIERLLSRRRGIPLQMIVGAMGCLHAKVVCEQINDMFGDTLRVDWVGTGPHGRDQQTNESILRKFCPPKVNGVRRSSDVEVDVLVHVGMAGEGLDSIYVAEVVHLNAANLSNQNDQENGRASRIIPGAPPDFQWAYINVDSSSPYAKWPGKRIMEAFDRVSGDPPDDVDEADRASLHVDDSDMPDEPFVLIAECELARIDRGDPLVLANAVQIAEAKAVSQGYTGANLDSIVAKMREDIFAAAEDDAVIQRLIDLAVEMQRQKMRASTADLVTRSQYAQMRHDLNIVAGKIARAVATMRSPGTFDKALLGSIKKRVNSEVKMRFGNRDSIDDDRLEAAYKWLVRLLKSLKTEDIPSWLQ